MSASVTLARLPVDGVAMTWAGGAEVVVVADSAGAGGGVGAGGAAEGNGADGARAGAGEGLVATGFVELGRLVHASSSKPLACVELPRGGACTGDKAAGLAANGEPVLAT
jgi:hypothetical protein